MFFKNFKPFGFRPTYGLAGAVVDIQAAWALDILGLGHASGGTSTSTNKTVMVLADTAAIADGFTVIEIPDTEDIPILDYAQLDTSTWVYSFKTKDGTNTPLAPTETINTDSGPVEVLIPGDPDVKGIFSGLSATTHLLNSTAPATQTTLSLGTGFYTLWQDGAGSSDLTAGTATIDTTGSATDGSPFTVEVTGAGTVTVTIVGGPPDAFQLESGTVRTPLIVSTTGEVTRAATITSEPTPAALTPSYGAGLIFATPSSVAGIQNYLGSYLDGANSLRVFSFIGTTATISKIIGGTTTFVDFAYNSTVGTTLAVLYKYGQDGIQVTAADFGGTFGVVATNPNADNVVLGTTLETGSANGSGQYQGHIANNFVGTYNDMIDLAESYGMDVSNLVRE